MENEVIEIKKIVFPTEQKIQEVEERFRVFPTDMTIPENYALVKNGVKKVKKLITATEEHRKKLKKPALEYGRMVDKIAKEISGRFKAVNEPMVKVVTEFETRKEIERRESERKEAERQEKIEKRIDVISGLAGALMLADAERIKTEIKKLTEDNLAWADEHLEAVTKLKEKTIQQLNELYQMKIAKAAAEKAEQERIRREQEAHQAILAENARLWAENEKKEAALRMVEQQKQEKRRAEALAENITKTVTQIRQSCPDWIVQDVEVLIDKIIKDGFEHIKWVD